MSLQLAILTEFTKGHCAVLEDALAESDRINTSALVITFEPHPRTVFRPEHPVFRLTPVIAKSDLVCALGFDGSLDYSI